MPLPHPSSNNPPQTESPPEGRPLCWVAAAAGAKKGCRGPCVDFRCRRVCLRLPLHEPHGCLPLGQRDDGAVGFWVPAWLLMQGQREGRGGASQLWRVSHAVANSLLQCCRGMHLRHHPSRLGVARTSPEENPQPASTLPCSRTHLVSQRGRGYRCTDPSDGAGLPAFPRNSGQEQAHQKQNAKKRRFQLPHRAGPQPTDPNRELPGFGKVPALPFSGGACI